MVRPEILSETRDDTTATLRFEVSPALSFFDGHFAGYPILPGIVQVHWAIEYTRQYFKVPSEIVGIENLKFLRLVRPGAMLALVLRYESTKRKMYFSYDGSTVKYSSGAVVFGA